MKDIKLKGGAPQKRKAISITEMKALDSDPDMVKAVFGLTDFKVCYKRIQCYKTKIINEFS